MSVENEIGRIVVDSAVAVHRMLGPGLLESVYERVLANRLAKQELVVECQVPIAFECDGQKFDEGFRVDILVGKKVIIELKSVEKVLPVHLKQLQTYLKLSGCRLGFLINFNVELLKYGVTRCVNNLSDT